MVKPMYDLSKGPSVTPKSIEDALADVRMMVSESNEGLFDPMATAVEAYRVLRHALAKFTPPVND